MSDHEYQTEKRRAGSTRGQRYQQGGRGSRQWERQGGQTSQSPGHQTGGRMASEQTTGGSGQMSGDQMSGSQMSGSQMSGGQMSGSQTTGGRMAGHQTSQPTGQRSSQPTSQHGGQQMGRQPIQPVTVREIAATDVVTAQPDEPLTNVVQKMATADVGAVVVAEGDRPVGMLTDRRIALAIGETPDVSHLCAADLMSEDLVTVPEGTDVFELVRRLGDRGIRRVPVVGEQGDLRGIVSLDDIVALLAEEFYNVGEIIRKQSPRL